MSQHLCSHISKVCNLLVFRDRRKTTLFFSSSRPRACQIKLHFQKFKPHPRKMFDLPESKHEFMTQYAGEGDDYDRLLRMEARERGDGSYLRVTDKNCDKNLFPYYAKGPWPGPIPTAREIVDSGIQEGSDWKWRVGPYHVTAGANVKTLQVKQSFYII